MPVKNLASIRKRCADGKKKEELTQLEPQKGKGGTILQTLNCSQTEHLSGELSTLESIKTEMIENLSNNMNLSNISSQIMKLSEIKQGVVITIDKGYGRFWNNSTQEMSNKLSYRINQDSLSDQNIAYSKESLKTLDAKSSLSTIQNLHMNENNLNVLEKLQNISVKSHMEYAQSKLKSRTTYIRIKKKLAWIYKEWLRFSVDIYNKSLNLLKEEDKLTQYELRDKIKEHFEQEINSKSMPNTSLEYAVFEAHSAFNMGKEVKYRDYKTKSLAISIDGRNIKQGHIYMNNTKRMLKTKFGKLYSNVFEETRIEKLLITPSNKVCKLIYKPYLNKFYINYPIPIEKSTTTKDWISLDPGIRTFQTFYDGDTLGEIGKNMHVKLKRYSKQCDKLASKISKEKRYYKCCKMKKAKARIEEKMKNTMADCHKKACSFLTKYKYVILPEFKVKQLAKKNSYIRRSLSNLSHFSFKLRLVQKASETDSRIIICNEACTSKTCTKCGYFHTNLGKSKVFDCPNCKNIIDRDFNGARNILLRVLRDGSCGSNTAAVDCCDKQ